MNFKINPDEKKNFSLELKEIFDIIIGKIRKTNVFIKDTDKKSQGRTGSFSVYN